MDKRIKAATSYLMSLILAFTLSFPAEAFADKPLVAQSPTTLSTQASTASKSTTIRLGKTSSLTLYAGSATKGTSVLKVSGKSAKKCKWSSSNKTVATVSKTGKVTAKKAGSAKITARYGTKKAACRVTVKKVHINRTSATLKAGETISLALVGDTAVRAYSSNNNVASVSGSGKVRALAAGDATITLVSGNGKTYKCQITSAGSEAPSAEDSTPPAPVKDSTPPAPVEDSALPVPVESISVSPDALELTEGEKPQAVIARVLPDNATVKTVTYTSSDPSVASVDASGFVTPVSAGEAVITVTTADKTKSASCNVRVLKAAVPVESVSFPTATLELEVGGDPVSCPAAVTPDNATNREVLYSSSDTSVAIVDPVGLVTPVSAGEAFITATSQDGSKSASCKVVVSASITPVSAIRFATEEMSFTVGDAPASNRATVLPDNATNKTVAYSSSDPDIATVDSQGTVTPKRSGETIVTAVSEDSSRSATCRVVVREPKPVAVSSMAFEEPRVTLTVGDAPAANQLTILPENATNQDVSYQSSDESVAKVDRTGFVTAIKGGTATITATSEDGGKTAAYTVEVVSPDTHDAMSVIAETQAVELGETALITCTVSGDSDGDYSIKWRSSSDGGKTWNDCKNEGYNTDKLQVTATEKCLDMQYQCSVTDTAGKLALSEPISIQVTNIVATVTTSQVSLGGLAKLVCSVSGDEGSTLAYQWQRSTDATSWEDVSGATSSTYSLKATVDSMSYRYRCVVTTESERSAFSESIALDVSTSAPDVQYAAHVSNIGWMSYVKNGQTAGTTGRSLRMEAMKIKLNDPDGTSAISYRAHVADKGWQGWASSDAIAGTVGQSRRMEALQVKLTGDYATLYDVYYRAHVANIGWLGWAKNGETAGSEGMAVQVEAFEVKLVRKGDSFDRGRMHELKKPSLTYQAHLADIGWASTVKEGATAGTIGQGRRMEALKVNLTDFDGISSGIRYKAHLADTGWQANYVGSGAVAGTVGEKRQMECITMELSGGISSVYDIYYRVHVQDYGWLGWAKNGERAGTTGGALRMEAIEIKLAVKGTSFNRGGTAYHDVNAERTAALASQAQVRLNVPHYYQTDSRWSNVYVGNKTIGQIGCLITSMAMIHSYHTGTTVYPNAMKNMLSFSGNNLIWSSVTRLGYEMTDNYNTRITNNIMALVYSRLKKGEPVIIGGASGSSTHWVVITGYTGSSSSSFSASDFTINDPNSSSRTTLASFLSYRPSVLRLIF